MYAFPATGLRKVGCIGTVPVKQENPMHVLPNISNGYNKGPSTRGNHRNDPTLAHPTIQMCLLAVPHYLDKGLQKGTIAHTILCHKESGHDIGDFANF